MHHRPSGPPVSARLRSFAARLAWSLRPLAGTRTRRLGVLLAVTAAVTAVLLATPVVTAPAWPSLAVDSSSSQTPTTAPPVESSTAWPAPRTSPTGSPAPVADEEPVADPTGPGAPATSEQATSAPPTTEAIPADESTTAPAPAPSEQAPAPSPSTAAAGSPAAPAAPAATATPEVLGTEARVLALVNQHRADAGCAPLAADEGLAGVARAHSADMRDQDFFAHVNLAGADPFTRAEQAGTTARAENIAQGQQDAAAAVDAWMDSAGHRANILDCSLERLGVGVATGAGGPWWTQLFG